MMRHSGVLCCYSWKFLLRLFFPAAFPFPSEFFLKSFLRMRNAWCMADENWFVFQTEIFLLNQAVVCSECFDEKDARTSEKFPTLSGFRCLLNKIKFFDASSERSFIGFKLWLKIFEMSKYWSLQLKIDGSVISHLLLVVGWQIRSIVVN